MCKAKSPNDETENNQEHISEEEMNLVSSSTNTDEENEDRPTEKVDAPTILDKPSSILPALAKRELKELSSSTGETNENPENIKKGPVTRSKKQKKSSYS